LLLESVPKEGAEWVFTNPKTNRPFVSIFNAWNTARNKAGLSGLRIHDLRHSFASALVNHGVPIYDVQKLLGHQSIKTTERYSHLSPERLRESASAASIFYGNLLQHHI
jgi:site-specific recombinase XerD